MYIYIYIYIYIGAPTALTTAGLRRPPPPERVALCSILEYSILEYSIVYHSIL